MQNGLRVASKPTAPLLRFGEKVWRFAFAFDPSESAIILCGGDKQSMSQTLFYKTLIRKADTRFSAWLKEKRNGH